MTTKKPDTSKIEELNAEDLDQVTGGGYDASSPYLVKGKGKSADGKGWIIIESAKGDVKPDDKKGLLGDELGVLRGDE
ncbi:MAG: hypothetical protein AAGH60_03535 [Pseudomonadota bacterium]